MVFRGHHWVPYSGHYTNHYRNIIGIWMVYLVIPNEKCVIIEMDMYYQKISLLSRRCKVRKPDTHLVVAHNDCSVYFHCCNALIVTTEVTADIQLCAFWMNEALSSRTFFFVFSSSSQRLVKKNPHTWLYLSESYQTDLPDKNLF